MRGRPALTEASPPTKTRLHGREIAQGPFHGDARGMQALALAFQLILDLGQNVVYLEPQWPNIANLIHLSGGEGIPVPARLPHGDWRLDMDAIVRACDARTRAMIYSRRPSRKNGVVLTSGPRAARISPALLAFGASAGSGSSPTGGLTTGFYWDGRRPRSILEIA